MVTEAAIDGIKCNRNMPDYFRELDFYRNRST